MSPALTFMKYKFLIHSRFLHVRMLLFRPILSKYCTARDMGDTDPLISIHDSFPQRVALQCSIICVKVAQEVVELIYTNIPADGTSGPLPAWWYNILCETPSIFLKTNPNRDRRLHSGHRYHSRTPLPRYSRGSHRVCPDTILELCS